MWKGMGGGWVGGGCKGCFSICELVKIGLMNATSLLLKVDLASVNLQEGVNALLSFRSCSCTEIDPLLEQIYIWEHQRKIFHEDLMLILRAQMGRGLGRPITEGLAAV